MAALLQDLDLDAAWDEATDPERRVLVEELVEKVAVFPDHLGCTFAGTPRLHVASLKWDWVATSRRTLVSEGGLSHIRHARRSGIWPL